MSTWLSALMDCGTARLDLHAVNEMEAKHIRDRTPQQGDAWAADYPFDGDLAAIGSFLRATEQSGEQRPFGHYQIRVRSDGLAVGGVGFKGPPAGDVVEIGYGLVPSARGHGYAAEAVGQLIQIAAEAGVTTIRADTELDNVASRRTLGRASPPQIDPTHPESADLADPIQRGHHRLARHPSRPTAQPLQIGGPRALGHLQQQLQRPGLLGGEQPRQGLPQPLHRRAAHPGHQPGQGAHPRQEHAALPQPGHRPVEQRLRPVPTRPRPVGHPPNQLVLHSGELHEPVGDADLPGMPEPGHLPHPIRLHTRGISDAQLLSEVVEDLGRRVRRIGQERAHKHQRGQLNLVTKPRVRQSFRLDPAHYGAAADPLTPTSDVAVPNVVGLRWDDARASLHRARLVAVGPDPDGPPLASLGCPMASLSTNAPHREFSCLPDRPTRYGSSVVVPAQPASANPGVPSRRLGRCAACSTSQPAPRRASGRPLLVLDEPTAALHGREVDRLFAAVKRVAAEGAGVLFISHRLDEVFALADRVVVLRDGQVIAKRRIDELDENSLITIIAGRELASLEREAAIVGGALLSACDLAGGTVQRLDLTASAGEVVGIAGLLGSGREDAADLIFGMADRVRGHVTVGNVRLRPGPRSAISASVALVPADRAAHGLLPDLTVRENLTLPRLRPFRGRSGRLVRKTERSEVARWIDRFDVRPRQPEKAIGLLSGGNQQKVMLARWLRNDPKVLLLDEPTQGVDVGVKATIYELVRDLAKQGRAVVLLSSDAKELALVCDRILVMYDGCVVAELSGDAITEAEVLTASLGLPSTLNAETVHKENHHV